MGVVALLSAESVPGQFDSLIKNPPFGQPATAVGNPGDRNASVLEFSGVFVDKGEYFFSLHETATRSSQWVGVKEAGQPYLVESYDSAKGSIQVLYHNQPMTLTLKRAQVIVQTPPAPASQVPAPVVGAGPSPPDEAGRLALVAQEIRRRRALRVSGAMTQQQAANPLLPGPGPSPSPSPSSGSGPGPLPIPIPSSNSGPGPMPVPSSGPGPIPGSRSGPGPGPSPATTPRAP